VAANVLNKQSRTAGKGWSFILGVGPGPNNFAPQKRACYEMLHRAWELLDTCEHGNEPSRNFLTS